MGSYTYRASDFGAANAKDPNAGAQWVCNAQLHRCAYRSSCLSAVGHAA